MTPTNEGSENGAERAVLYLRVSTKEQAQKGGQAEGYSIPAQRQAGKRKAEALGAVVVEEFVDAGESARSADRPQLQKMLQFIESESVQYLIVHKIDRLARNRLDDLMISLALERSGVALVSCSENIDKSPSGKLTHGLMALIAEWYSSNLSQEVRTKVLQKVQSGGTATKAPIGYRNIRKIENGREFRTVAIDADRAALVQWAFEVYASGEWSLNGLTEALADRGLTNAPTAHYAEKPLAKASVHRMLRNSYYTGIVTWQSIEYQGLHEPLISAKLFEQVQEVLTAHNIAGERARVHHHYLKGSVWCADCGSRLCITKTTNRHGSRYEYFFCIGRNQKRTACTQKTIPIDVVEAHIEEKWRHVRISPEYAQLLRDLLEQEISKHRQEAERDRNVAQRRIQALMEQRKKLLDLHYAAAITVDLVTSEQRRITAELNAAKQLLAATQTTFETIEATLKRCLAFLSDCHTAYLDAGTKERRHMNQAVFERFLVSADGSTEAKLTDIFSALLAPNLITSDEAPEAVEARGHHRNGDWLGGIPARLRTHWNSKEPRPTLVGLGLNKTHMVPPAGFEPALQP